MWRQLAGAARGLNVSELEALAPRADGWASPLESKGASFALFGLARWARAYARATVAERGQLGPVLAAGGAVAAELLEDHAPPPPALPYRADLDG